MKRIIGIMGGTFDPVHIGHMAAARAALRGANLDEVWFLPTAYPPHKSAEQLTSSEHRLRMLELAKAEFTTDEKPLFRISTHELERGGISYSIDTAQQLHTMYPDKQFCWIIGADMVAFLPQWERIEQLADQVTFIGLARAGYDIHALEWPDYLRGKIKIVPFTPLEISSTTIRERLRQRLPIQGMLPDSVRRYIEENALYENGTNPARG